MLHGRAAELAAIELLLASAHRQQSGALVLTGEAGIGKTALLSYAAQRADGMSWCSRYAKAKGILLRRQESRDGYSAG